MRLYADGKLTESHEALRLRGQEGADTLISKFLFSTFHGGNDPSWAPLTPTGDFATVHAWFDNFAVEKGVTVRKVAGG